MSTPFQNRLVGTIIVAAAAIIFLPDLLNGEKKSHKDTFEAMPLAPKVTNVAAIKKFPSKKLSRLSIDEISNDVAQDHQLLAVSSKPEKSTKAAVTKQSKLLKPSITSKHTKKSLSKNTKKSVPSVAKPIIVKQASSRKSKPMVNGANAWVIQLGSFRERHNVDSLINKLKKNGYTAYSKPIKTRHGNLIKVFVGPELSKSLLAGKLNKLKKLTNMQGKIARFKADK